MPQNLLGRWGFIRPLINKHVIADLTPFILADNVDTSDFFPTLLEPFTLSGHYYGLPNDATSLALFYNQGLFDKAKLKYPDENWTWDDLLKAAIKLTMDTQHNGQIDHQWGLFLLNVPDNWFPFVYQNGGHVFDPKNPDKLCVTEPASLEAIQFYVDLTLKYHVAPSHSQAIDMDILQGFELGKVAMIIGGWWDIPDIAKYAPNLRYGVVPLPQHKFRATASFATATVMDKNAKHPKETWEFIKFMTGKEGQLIRCKSGMAGPSRKSVANDPYFKR
jgi:multiple sugar transport system substrate-binding protein